MFDISASAPNAALPPTVVLRSAFAPKAELSFPLTFAASAYLPNAELRPPNGWPYVQQPPDVLCSAL